jgi:hypothetical protein
MKNNLLIKKTLLRINGKKHQITAAGAAIIKIILTINKINRRVLINKLKVCIIMQKFLMRQ